MIARRGIAALVVMVSVLLAVAVVSAQTGSDPPLADRLREILTRPPEPPTDQARPAEAARPREPARTPQGPGFIGPLRFRTATTEGGVGGWVAPNTARGARAAAQPDQWGWLGFGFAIEWDRSGLAAKESERPIRGAEGP